MGRLGLADDIDTIPGISCSELQDPDMCSSFITPTYDFKVLTMNIRSITKNFDAFMITLTRLNTSFDVIILTECRLNDSIIIEEIPGYNHYSTKHNINQNGGVVAFIKSSWPVAVTEPTFGEAVCLSMSINDQIAILGIYRSPSFRNLNNFLYSLDKYLYNLKDRQCVIVAGDINIDILDAESNEYLCLYAEHGLEPVITKPTRINACLDHIFVRTRNPAVGVVHDCDITDHKIAMLGLNTKMKHLGQCRSKNKTVLDLNAVCNDLSAIDWGTVTSLNCVDDAVEALSKIVEKTFYLHSKRIKITRSKYVIKPWMTPGLVRCSRHKDRLHTKMKQHPNDEIAGIIYKRYRNFYINIIRKVKLDYEKQELHKNQKNTKELWKSIKNICYPKPIHSNDLVSASSNPKAALDKCNVFFSSVGRNLADDILSQSRETENDLASKINCTRTPAHSFFMAPTDREEVTNIISQLKKDTAPGLDGITSTFLKSAGDILCEPLVHIFNLSLESGSFPSSWKIAIITPIHKNGPKDAPSNYRPISLLPTFSKILEKIVNRRLTKFIELNGMISPRQFGFRRNKSTEDAVLLLTELICGYLDNGQKCVGVFLDLAKAFDTVSPKILCRKLERLGIRGVALDWFKSYLTGRQQITRVEQHKSDLLPVHFGVPQGSILGPTLFIIYMNDMHDLQLLDAEVICYADDTVVLFKGNTWNDTVRSSETGMTSICHWLNNNLLTLNYSKTNFVCFHKTAASAPSRNDKIVVHSCDLDPLKSCTCNFIVRTNSTKYLGIIIDEQLNFKMQIQHLVKRVRKISGIFRRLRYIGNLELLINIYKALCESVTGYCISAWGSAAKTAILDIERANRSILKIMLRKPFRFPTTELYKTAKVLTVRQLFVLRVTMIAHKNVVSSTAHKSLLRKRVFKVPLPTIHTHFASRFGKFIQVRVYNSVISSCNIKSCSVSEAKSIVLRWLLSLDYLSTERILS